MTELWLYRLACLCIALLGALIISAFLILTDRFNLKAIILIALMIGLLVTLVKSIDVRRWFEKGFSYSPGERHWKMAKDRRF